MTVPTTAEAKATDVRRVDGIGRSSAAASASADSAQNVVGEYGMNLDYSAGTITHKMREFISPIIPTATDYAYAKIGDRFLVPLVDSAQSTTAPYDFDIYVKTANGFEKMLTHILDEQLANYSATPFDAADTAPTLTAAQVLGGIVVGTPTAARAYTLPSATNLLAAIPRAKIGTTIRLTVVNGAAATHVITLTPSASIALGHAGHVLTVAATASKTFLIRFDDVTTPTAKVYGA